MLSLQRKCIKACHDKYKPSKRPTMPSEVADEENDPRLPRSSGVSPRPPRPSVVSPRLPLKSVLIGLVCFITISRSSHAPPNNCVMSS